MDKSIVIIVKNGVNTIERTLKSLQGFDDVIVYDNGSTDGTQDIVTQYNNVNLIEGDFLGFGPTKNKAASYAKHDWIVILDSDEVMDEELYEILKTTTLDENKVYILNFHAYYKEIRVKYCGWNNQKIKRVYNKSVTRFDDNLVHEDIIVNNLKLEELNGNVKHYSYDSISDFIIKVDRYSTLFAKEKAGIKKSSPSKAIFSSIYAFFKTYILRKGFLDGWIGLVISYSRASVVFYKYIKLYEMNKELKK
ncbi:MAG: glycosyltransferase family 2 protein [Thiovulaceae bacterium]|nr:glycosyltransferase family 2 protein [Sulfurimonadaceae bacterium]